ncbi:DoxX family protein [Croceivirga sp. JEA036]|uniref:DoxX family protein n=1 Tax=Croceivirga sp. JEA036 TaxID=2721162 RepID=UPI00143B9C69|nr:DoxX family protein [Croceivirga sp. JEA036]NJB37423.1 DoxX family protein [Croceivirga sp. JEA036]
MEYVTIAIKIFIFLSIFNVWVIRFHKSTPWRGGEAKSMEEEFEAYGLGKPMMYLVGGLKLLSAVLLLASIWVPSLIFYGAPPLAILMIGAIIMHIKVNDPIKKSLPAFIFLILSILLLILK